jgi:hypothetical protein
VVAVLVDVVAAGQGCVVVVVLEEVAGAGADDVHRAGEDGPRLGAPGHRSQLGLVLLVVLELLGQRDRVLQVCTASSRSTCHIVSSCKTAKNGCTDPKPFFALHTIYVATCWHMVRDDLMMVLTYMAAVSSS